MVGFIHRLVEWDLTILASISNQQWDSTVTSDASGNLGCGAFWGSAWFQLQWAGLLHEAHIAIKELVPLILAAAL